MSKFSTTLVAGNLLGNTSSLNTVGSSIAARGGAGFKNMAVLTTVGIYTWVFPPGLRVPGAKFKCTIVGAGGQGGGGAGALTGIGAGGNSGGVMLVWFTVYSPCYHFVYQIGNGGSSGTSSTAGQSGTAVSYVNYGTQYASEQFSAAAGQGGAFATSGGSDQTAPSGGGVVTPTTTPYIYINGFKGGGTASASSSTYPIDGKGADTPFGFGIGGPRGLPNAGGSAGTGYGSGGGGGFNTGAGGAGGDGIIIVQW
jgi:hypothetical protein